jgi:hypothetical protein
MVGVILIALLVLVWIIFGMIILVNIVKDNIKYKIDKWKNRMRSHEGMGKEQGWRD